MAEKSALVVTSISPPTQAMEELAAGAIRHRVSFYCIGDAKSPPTYELQGCRFVSLQEQLDSRFRFASSCPTGHYARKNVGYLLAIAEGATTIVETDDDNRPLPEFWHTPAASPETFEILEADEWLNVYSFFSDCEVWPRGFPLEQLQREVSEPRPGSVSSVPVLQGLADGDPDVDAVYRLTRPLPLTFDRRRPVALAPGTWCPFNSQNTAWQSEAFPLLYLPSHCSFRMTDIWRSFVAQACLWTNDWGVGFTSATVFQERNEHDLLRDFEQEVPGYLNNRRIAERLSEQPLEPGEDRLGSNMQHCYRALVELDLVGRAELDLLDAWLDDLEGARR